MARCEDFPCCGHELGCCPDYDESGRQLNIRCVCGASLPVDARFSCCDSCLNSDDDSYYFNCEYDDSDEGDGYGQDCDFDEGPEFFQ